MPRKQSQQGMGFRKVTARRQGLSQHVQPKKGEPQRAANANPRRKH